MDNVGLAPLLHVERTFAKREIVLVIRSISSSLPWVSR